MRKPWQSQAWHIYRACPSMLSLCEAVSREQGISCRFPALSQALHGDDLFTEYEQRFLKHDVQGEPFKRTINPFTWGKLLTGTYWRSEMAAASIATHFLEVGFDNIRDPQDRNYFMNRPTTFVLPEEAVNRLRDIAAELLNHSPEYQNDLREFTSEVTR
jgi:hypothetical protein